MARYCPYCVSRIEQGNTCPYCDGALRYRPKEHHLKPGTLLNNKYLVGRALGEGGFGITYVGRDLTLDMKVAIRCLISDMSEALAAGSMPHKAESCF